MFRSNGLFDSFNNLNQVNPANLINWLKPVPQLDYLENYLANRILYPQTLPFSEAEMNIELAILREVLKLTIVGNSTSEQNPLLGNNPFFNFTLRKVLIPSHFLSYIPNLNLLVWIFSDVLISIISKKDWFEDLWTVVLKDGVDETVGTIILPQFEKKDSKFEITISGKVFNIAKNSLVVVPCNTSRCEVAYKIDHGKFLGKSSSVVEVYGGKLGLLIDGRRQ